MFIYNIMRGQPNCKEGKEGQRNPKTAGMQYKN